MPSGITFSDGSSITYTYAADGTKLRTVHKIGSATTTTDYCGNVIYENGVQKLLLTEEGYISLGDNKYHYYLKDHEGNNRVVINQSGGVEETNHYYPFGGLFASASNVQAYKYNGKEYDSRKGLNWYDYGARHYDAALGRFATADRFAEKYPSMSIYQYGANNPVNNIDVNGDSVRVHVETESFGHSWVSVGEGNDKIVYSYGRFNGTYKGREGIHSFNAAGNGDGVLLRMTGKEAKEYMSKKEALDMSSFVVSDIKDSEVLKILDKMFYSSRKMPDNPQSDWFGNPSAHIIDNYRLTGHNCTTFVSDVLNQAGSNALNSMTILQTSTFGTYISYPIKERFIIPSSFKRFLNQVSKPNGIVYKINK